MPVYRYSASGRLFRNWRDGFAFNVNGFNFAQICEIQKHKLTDGWEYQLSTRVKANNENEAIELGLRACTRLLDLIAVVTEQRVEYPNRSDLALLQKDGSLKSVELRVYAPLIYRADEAPSATLKAWVSDIAKGYKTFKTPGASLLQHSCHYYAEAIRELDPIDHYIKIWIALEALVPPGRTFRQRCVGLLHSTFATSNLSDVSKCVDVIYNVRNKIFHLGVLHADFAIASKALNKIVPSLLRKQSGLALLVPSKDLFKI